MKKKESLFYQIALTRIKGVGDITARNLLEIIGNEEEIFRLSKKSLMAIDGISTSLANEIVNPEVLKSAETELKFIEKNKIQTFFIKDPDYPYRLKEFNDAPLLLYYRGNTNLNNNKIISIVGTRRSTDYGNSFCENFIQEIAAQYPDILIVSGLAYGIDIKSHETAIKANLPTVGVLGHGLDRIYPASHRKTAIEMLGNGGLLTEFGNKTEPDRYNFVRRNRIVAGMADAVVVVETDTKGGSLITAEIANTYNKDVFAVPGRINDPASKGCNKLIIENKAVLLDSANNFLRHMNWLHDDKPTKPKQRQLVFDLNQEEQKIYNILLQHENIHINQLSVYSEIPVSRLLFILLEMELKNIVKPFPGSTYNLR